MSILYNYPAGIDRVNESRMRTEYRNTSGKCTWDVTVCLLAIQFKNVRLLTIKYTLFSILYNITFYSWEICFKKISLNKYTTYKHKTGIFEMPTKKWPPYFYHWKKQLGEIHNIYFVSITTTNFHNWNYFKTTKIFTNIITIGMHRIMTEIINKLMPK